MRLGTDPVFRMVLNWKTGSVPMVGFTANSSIYAAVVRAHPSERKPSMFYVNLKAMIAACLAALVLNAPGAAVAQERTLDPVDEGAKDPSWVSFKNRLLNAVAKRDRKFVTSILHASVRSGLQGGRG